MDAVERESFIAYAQLPAFKRKVERSLAVIKEALAIGPAYVAVSWGKDSVVMLHLCQQVQPDILAVFLGHSEQDLISNFSEVAELYCSKWSTNYLPIHLSREEELIYDPQKIRKTMASIKLPVAFVGVRAEESINRRRSLKRYGAIHQYKHTGKTRCFPLAYWGWEDVWGYICSNDLPYLSAYDLTPKSAPSSRTALHFGRSNRTRLGAERWEQFKLICPEFVEHVRGNYENTDWL